ncbi:MAG: hypothetical protein AABX29_03215 [Nanoarchaeota archaeon]
MATQERKLIALTELREAIEEAERMGIPRSRINITFLDDRVEISHPEDPGDDPIYGVAIGEVIQTVRHYGCNVQTQRTSSRPYL